MEPAVQKRRSSGQVLALVIPPPEPEPSAPEPRRRWPFFLKLGLGVLAVAGALLATGYVVYEQAQQKAVRKELRRARRLAALDTPAAYGAAMQILEKVAARRPGDARLVVKMAEIHAFLWGRFGGSERARRDAIASLARARELKADPELLAALKGYHLIFQGRFAEAARHAEAALLVHRRSARLDYVLGMARYFLGDLTAAVATFKLAVAHDSHFLPARVALGRMQRQRGHPRLALATLKRVLAESPGHPEARLEVALIPEAGSQAAGEAEHRRLLRMAKDHPPLLALAKLASGRDALAEGDFALARRLLREGALLAPDDPEIALELVASQLLPGGDARKAWADHERLADRSREYRKAASVFARAALAAGRPKDALKFLRKPVAAALPPELLRQRLAVKVAAARELDQPEIADRVCAERFRRPGPGGGWQACLVYLARSRRGAEMEKILSKGVGVAPGLVSGLMAFRQRDYPRAVRLLSKATRGAGVAPEVLGVLAESLQKMERPMAALAPLRRAVGLGCQAVRQRLDLAWGLARSRREKDASRILRELIREAPRGARTLMDMGLLGLRLGLTGEVSKLAKLLTKAYPASGHGPYLSAVLYLRAGKRRKARARLDVALMRDPLHVPSKLALARLAFWRGDVGGGRLLFE